MRLIDKSVAEELAGEIQDRDKRIVELEVQNKRYREALEGVLKYRHVDEGLKAQLRKVLEVN